MTMLKRIAAKPAWTCAALMISLAGALCGTPARAETMTTTPALRQAAVTACTGDVLRLCPSVIFDEQRVFACMKTNRAQLSPSCRAVFDEGAKTVRR